MPYESPNIVIVPTVSFCGPPQKKAKPNVPDPAPPHAHQLQLPADTNLCKIQPLDQDSTSLDNSECPIVKLDDELNTELNASNNSSLKIQEITFNSSTICNTSSKSKGNNPDQEANSNYSNQDCKKMVKKTLSWASNYLKSIGQSQPKTSMHNQSPALLQQKDKRATIQKYDNEPILNFLNRSNHFENQNTLQQIDQRNTVESEPETLETSKTEINNIKKHIKINLLNVRNSPAGSKIDRAHNSKPKDKVTSAQRDDSKTRTHYQNRFEKNIHSDNGNFNTLTSKLSDLHTNYNNKHVERGKRATSRTTTVNKTYLESRYQREERNVTKNSNVTKEHNKCKPNILNKIISKRHLNTQKAFNAFADYKHTKTQQSFSAKIFEKYDSPGNSSNQKKMKTIPSSMKISGKREIIKHPESPKKNKIEISNESKTIPINSVVNNVVIKNLDLNEPLHKTERKHYNYETTTVENESEEHLYKNNETNKLTITDIKPPKHIPETRKFKKIKLVINLVCEKYPESSESDSDGKNNEYPIANVDLSFLDDFNVDDIVDCLKSPEANNINFNKCESFKTVNKSKIEIKNKKKMEDDLKIKSIDLKQSCQESDSCGSWMKIEQNTCNAQNVTIENQTEEQKGTSTPVFTENDCNINYNFQSRNKTETVFGEIYTTNVPHTSFKSNYLKLGMDKETNSLTSNYENNIQENTDVECMNTNAAHLIDQNNVDVECCNLNITNEEISAKINSNNNKDVEVTLLPIEKNIDVITISDTEEETCLSENTCHTINNNGNFINNSNIDVQCAEHNCVFEPKELSYSLFEISPNITECIDISTDEDQSGVLGETLHPPQNTEAEKKPISFKVSEDLSEIIDITDDTDLTKTVNMLDTVHNTDATVEPTLTNGNKTQTNNEILDSIQLADINVKDTPAKKHSNSLKKLNLDFTIMSNVIKCRDVIMTNSEELIITEGTIKNNTKSIKNDNSTLVCSGNKSDIEEKPNTEKCYSNNLVSALNDNNNMINKYCNKKDGTDANNKKKSSVKNHKYLARTEKNTDFVANTHIEETGVLENMDIIIAGARQCSNTENKDEINKNKITAQSYIKNEITEREKINTKETNCYKTCKANISIKEIPAIEKVVQKTSNTTEKVLDIPVNKEHLSALNIRMLEYFREEFSITSLISQGKFSKVFACKDSRGRTYALKMMHSKTISYHREMEFMLKSIRQDIPKNNFHCIYLIDGFAALGQWCFLMEHFSNNLQIALADHGKSFHIDVVQKLSRQLISALVVLRNNNIIHLAVKPGHILLNASNDKLKLTGFDEARYLKDIKLVPNYGTVNYRPPEVILGFPSFVKADVWSAALLMYEMATGRKLFAGCYNNAILYKQQCLLGEVPPEMLEQSAYRWHHYHGAQFKRIIMKGHSVPVRAFNRSNRLYLSILNSYGAEWAGLRSAPQRAQDKARLKQLKTLLDEMLVLAPAARLPIEFVYAHPFLYEPYLD